MSWNTRPQGIADANQQIHFSGGLRPVYQTGNATSDAVQQAIAAIAQILRQRQQDKIANQLLAVDNAQPAVAVDGTQKGSGQSDTQLTDAMVKQNIQTGYPTTPGKVPDRGGVEGLQWADLIHKRDQERMKEQWAMQDRPLDVKYRQAQIDELQRRHTGYGSGDQPPIWTDPETGHRFAVGPSGGLHPLSLTPGQEATTNKEEIVQSEKSLNQQIEDLNNYGGLIAKDKAGTVTPRITPLTLGSATDVHKGTGPQGEYIPEGYYGIGGKQLETVVPSGPFDAAHKASDAYMARLNQGPKTSESVQSKSGVDPAEALAQARAKIQAGADPAAVKARLQQLGIDPSQL